MDFKLFRDVVICLACLLLSAHIILAHLQPNRPTIDNGKYITDLYNRLGN